MYGRHYEPNNISSTMKHASVLYLGVDIRLAPRAGDAPGHDADLPQLSHQRASGVTLWR